MGNNGKLNVISSDDSEEVRKVKSELREEDGDSRKRQLIDMLMHKPSREYFIRKLDAVILEPELCAGDPEATGYNMGKADAYKEVLLELKDASEIATDHELETISEVFTRLFFSK